METEIIMSSFRAFSKLIIYESLWHLRDSWASVMNVQFLIYWASVMNVQFLIYYGIDGNWFVKRQSVVEEKKLR